jgi:hypothetical protein
MPTKQYTVTVTVTVELEQSDYCQIAPTLQEVRSLLAGRVGAFLYPSGMRVKTVEASPPRLIPL